VPPQGALLPDHVEPVGEGGVGGDGALRHHPSSVRPAGESLLHAVPATSSDPMRLGKADNHIALASRCMLMHCSRRSAYQWIVTPKGDWFTT
jgi:hypothetical protein